MFAVVKIAGQQFKVQEDQNLYVPHSKVIPEIKWNFTEVLLRWITMVTLTVGQDVKVKVNAEIVGEIQGDKVIAFKMKRSKGFRKKKGHRTVIHKSR